MRKIQFISEASKTMENILLLSCDLLDCVAAYKDIKTLKIHKNRKALIVPEYFSCLGSNTLVLIPPVYI